FSLIGSDLILSCPNEDSCLDYENRRCIELCCLSMHRVLDADEPTSNKNHLTLSGSAASFLGVKEISANLYQNFAISRVLTEELKYSDQLLRGTNPVESGTYLVDIGAVDRQSNALLAQTQLEIKVVGGA
ncbi:hypothetical protein OSTOST_21584, partial [Ostertagia ostertagi]